MACGSRAAAPERTTPDVLDVPPVLTEHDPRTGEQLGKPVAQDRAGDPACTPPSIQRTWVGFSVPFDYDHFDEAALHSEQLTTLVNKTFCVPHPALDPEGAFIAALSARPMRLSKLTFTRTQLDAADLLIEPQDKTLPAPSFLVGMRFESAQWQMISIAQRQ